MIGALGVLSVTAGGVGFYRYKQRLATNSSITAVEFHEEQKEQIDQVLENEQVFNNQKKILYQYTTCPFCCKLKAFLDFHKVEYDVVEVNPLSKTQISSHGYHKVPQLQVGDNGPILVDSAEIVKILKPILDKDAPTLTDEEQKWSEWASTTLVRYMVINTNRTLAESRAGYDYVSNIVNFTGSDKIILELFGGPIMYLVSKYAIVPKLKRTAGYDGENPRKALYKELNDWTDNGIGNNDFHGGDKPDMADLNVYGVIQSQRFLPVFNDIQSNMNPKFVSWYERMDKEMPEHYVY